MKMSFERIKEIKIFSLFAIFFIVVSFVFVSSQRGFLNVTRADFYGFPGGAPGPNFDASVFSNIRGWAWSGFTGWISFSCKTAGAGDICATENYGVYMITQADIDAGNFTGIYDSGALVGHAWSDSIGWISFDRAEATANGTDMYPGADPFPAKDYMAKIDLAGTKSITGWARAMSAANVGENWNGWIKLSGTGYGVSVGAGGDFVGYAWGGEAVGWISFNNSTGGGSNTYRVYIPSGGIPNVSNLSADFVDACTDNKNVRFNFTYNSGLGSNMTSFTIEIIRTGVDPADFSVPYKTLTYAGRTDAPGTDVSVLYSGANTTVPAGDLARNQDYEWRIMGEDEFGFNTGWAEDTTDPDFFVEANKRPVVVFDWNPKVIVPNIDVVFKSTGFARCYTGEVSRDCAFGSGDSFLWSIQNSVYTTGNQTSADPTVQFTSSGQKAISLQIRGNGFGVGEECSKTAFDILGGNIFNVSKPIPTFEEQRP